MPLIVGGGPAGAAAAIMLARGGLPPTVIERTAAPADALCGGFVSWNSVALLRLCGFDALASGGHVVRRARIFTGRHVVERPLPGLAVGLSRKRLDEALLDLAAQAGARIRRGVTVRSIEGGTIRYADGTSETPDHLVLATGKPALRGAARPVTSGDPAIGLRWRFSADPGLAHWLGDAIELHLFDHGYAGLILQEEGAANLCLAVRRSAFVAAGHSPERMLEALVARLPALAARLASQAVGPAQAVANIPYGWHATGSADGLYRVGDQIGVIPSLAGEGIGIALASGMAAGQAILAKQGADAYQDAAARFISRPIALARLLWSVAERPGLVGLALPLLANIPGLATAAMRHTRVSGWPSAR